MTRITLGDNIRQRSIELLAATLTDLVDLERQVKAAHWNVRGHSFIALHELFDRVATDVRDFGDTVAERLVTLGGYADASVQSVAASTKLDADVVDTARTEAAWVAKVADLIAAVGGRARTAIDAAADAGDANTADLLTGVSRELDNQLWLVEAHLG
jgi:starvation-inducible DNA-binding protein